MNKISNCAIEGKETEAGPWLKAESSFQTIHLQPFQFN